MGLGTRTLVCGISHVQRDLVNKKHRTCAYKPSKNITTMQIGQYKYMCTKHYYYADRTIQVHVYKQGCQLAGIPMLSLSLTPLRNVRTNSLLTVCCIDSRLYISII